jgi:dimethylargininase
MLALTHVPSPRMDLAQRTHVPPAAIDYERAVRQHAEYCRMLARCGVAVCTLDVNRDLPDSVFIEDTAVVLDEVAALASMGAASRRAEPAGIELELRKYREVYRIEAPATLEGGDVLQVGRTLLVGLSARTDKAGVSALEQIVRRHGYRVVAVAVRNCLHLKTACTALPDGSLLVNPAWLDKQGLQGFELVPTPDTEPWAANTLPIGQMVCVAAAHVHTAELIRRRGFAVETVDLSEFAKAEGGITCSSILLNDCSPSRAGK